MAVIATSGITACTDMAAFTRKVIDWKGEGCRGKVVGVNWNGEGCRGKL